MKIIKILPILAILIIAIACSEEKDEITGVPEKIEAAFSTKYENAKDIKWENEDGIWEAEFSLSGIEYEAYYDQRGEWAETKHVIELSEIPDNIMESIKSEYADRNILEVEKFDSREGQYYKLMLQKGGSVEEARFYPNGKTVKPEWKEYDEHQANKKNKKKHTEMDND